ncbi:MAG: PHP domain-containing protein [Ignavibacteriales bacterium]|nr:PHP domain-containing protein [Ignavibacteriales bacterium]
MHTSYSDGALSPYELVNKAKSVGLSIISITDHDSVSALDEAQEISKEFAIEIIPGTELSATLNGAEIHILGYFMDFHNKLFLDFLAESRGERLKRAERIVNKLNQMNIPLKMESVLANTTGDSVGRPHIANALVNEGHAQSYHQAFSKYIGNGRPAFEKKAECSPEEIVRIINQAGGLSFLAHPGHSVSDTLLFQTIKAGVDGIEVVHPSHTPDLVRYYRGIVNEYCLLESGGSDFHGGQKGDEHLLGSIGIPVSTVDIMRRRLFSN